MKALLILFYTFLSIPMKKSILVIVFLWSIQWVRAADVEPEAIVFLWNDLHNSKQTDLFKDLYGSEVLFYGKYKAGSYCAKQKAKFLTPDFQQEIISKVITTYHSEGTIKCAFTKRVTFRQMVKKHNCYLLLQEVDGQLKVTGESDSETDKRLGVQLNLGAVVSTTGKLTSWIVVLGLIMAVGVIGIWYYKRKRAAKANEMEEWVKSQPQPEPPVAEPVPVAPHSAMGPGSEEMIAKVKAAVLEEIKGATVTEQTNKEKGDAFERFVVERFDKEYFRVEEWRSDKYHEGHYAKSSMLPDIEFSFRTKYRKARFAVECKWRSEFKDSKIEWAKDRQLRTYKEYARREGMPVFAVIGVGGTPDNPESLYIVPIKNISSNILSENQMQRYFRYSKGDFFFNPDLGALS